MKWTVIKGKTNDFGKPAEWDETRDGPCGTLPIRIEMEGRYYAHYSNWRPSQEELDLLNAGGVVELCCVGVQPPVSVGVVPRHWE